MSCAGSIISACDFPNFLVDQTPKFDELIMEDIRPTDGWLLNVSTGTVPSGTPVEITQDRFRHVYPNVTKTWRKIHANGAGCFAQGPCDPPEHQIGWGADRLTYFTEGQEWQTPLICYDQDMHITHAEQHISQIVNEILRPATTDISSNFLRKRALAWAKTKWAATKLMAPFTFQWTNPIDGSLGGPNADEENYFYCSVAPSAVYLLVPQMLQNRFSFLMRRGYAGKNPFKENAPYIELVTDMDTCWSLDKFGNTLGTTNNNWRFTEWNAANAYWRYGFSGQIGNYQVRVDEMGLRFNYVKDLGAGFANRYVYQVVLPFRNGITTGAGGAAGLGSDANPDYDKAQFSISFIWHKAAMELLVSTAAPLNPEMPFSHRDFGGKWQFVMDNLGADANGKVITNKRRNKGQFIADFRYMVRPLHTEFAEAIFHARQQFVIPEIGVDPSNSYGSTGYPAQEYNSSLPVCPLPTSWPAAPVGTPTIDSVSAPQILEDTFEYIAAENTGTSLPTAAKPAGSVEIHQAVFPTTTAGESGPADA